MIGRADIEESKSDVATNAQPPQASYPCGNFSVTSKFDFRKYEPERTLIHAFKGSLGHGFPSAIRTENSCQADFWPYPLRKVSDLSESTFVHLCYSLTDVPPQPNSPPEYVRNRIHQQVTLSGFLQETDWPHPTTKCDHRYSITSLVRRRQE